MAQAATEPSTTDGTTSKNTSIALTDADLNAVERRLGFRFPDAFRKHYLMYNGGNPIQDRFVDESDMRIVHEFLPIKASSVPTLPTLERSLELLRGSGLNLPMHLIPFANDPFGNLYCFSARDEDLGAIYWVRIEGRGRPAQLLSTSLDDFLGKLRAKES